MLYALHSYRKPPEVNDSLAGASERALVLRVLCTPGPTCMLFP